MSQQANERARSADKGRSALGSDPSGRDSCTLGAALGEQAGRNRPPRRAKRQSALSASQSELGPIGRPNPASSVQRPANAANELMCNNTINLGPIKRSLIARVRSLVSLAGRRRCGALLNEPALRAAGSDWIWRFGARFDSLRAAPLFD